MNKNLISIIGGLILASIFLSPAIIINKTSAYNDKTTHPDLTREIIGFYELSTGKKFTAEERQLIIQGSTDEDLAPRWLNHFYDPVYERGLTTETISINGYSAKNWAEYSSYQTINPANIGNLWTGNGPVISGSWWGNFSYEAAVKNYSENKEKESYMALGHVLHLIEDMTVPEHTRNDPHPGGNMPSYYENWTAQNSNGLTKGLGKRLFSQGSRPVIYSDLKSYFNNLATYTNSHFFSPRTINSQEYQNPKIIFEDNTFAYGEDENGELFDLAYLTKDFVTQKTIYSVKDANYQVIQEYWLRLSRQAVINGAGVIELFLNQAEAAKQVELAKQKVDARQATQKNSLISQIYNFFSGPEAPASEPILVSSIKPVKTSPKIVKQKAAAKPVVVQKSAIAAQTLSKPSTPTQNPPAVSQNAPAVSQTQTNQTGQTNQQSQTNAPIVYSRGGGGGNSSSTSNSNSSSQQANQQTQNQNTENSPKKADQPLAENAPTFNAGDLAINEIMYNPEGTDDKHEWVELYNNSGREIALTGGSNGWKFDDGATSLHSLNEPPANGSQGSMTIASGGYVVLADNAETFLVDYSGYSGTVIDTVMDLKNSTSTIKAIKIIAPNGTIIDSVLYSNSWGADGNSKTLERKSATGGSNDAGNWAQSAAPGGTPGAANNCELTMSTTSLATLDTDNSASTTIAFDNIATSTPDIATSTLDSVSATSSPPIISLGTNVEATTIITTNTIWKLTGSPYRLFFDSQRRPTVAAGATLTIEPGVKIIPQGGGYTALEIQGTLSAIATSGAPIIFTSVDDFNGSAGSPQKGDWLNVAFTQGAQANLDYVEFRYGGQGITLPFHEMVDARGATININHSKFENSQNTALHLMDSSGVVENSVFSYNNCGISVDSSNGIANTGYGGCYGTHTTGQTLSLTALQIKNNRFIRNQLSGIELRSGTAPTVDGNIFTDNGVPIKIESSYPTITNSQLANSNHSTSLGQAASTFLGGIAISGYTHFSQNYTLKKDLPYILETNGPAHSPYVDAGAVLTIEPGVIFKTNNVNSALFIDGSLIA